ncbi:hypothetical protein BC831DRAFT_400038 [Entophlyctis helioformis]|nr:hypothetical protein BC831DRAFT_400038 [Entophlyctis helioformis]
MITDPCLASQQRPTGGNGSNGSNSGNGNGGDQNACCVSVLSIVGALLKAFMGNGNGSGSNPTDASGGKPNAGQQPTVVQVPMVPVSTQPGSVAGPQAPHAPPLSPPHKPAAQQKPHPGKPYEEHLEDPELLRQAEHFRSEAKRLGDERGDLYEASQQAWNSGDKAEAKELSDKAKAVGERMHAANAKASSLFFKAHNEGRGLLEIDLHGQFVKEAIALTDRRIVECREAGQAELVIIVGKGLHSPGGVAKIKPAIVELMQKHQLRAMNDHPNAGCLTVVLGSGSDRGTTFEAVGQRGLGGSGSGGSGSAATLASRNPDADDSVVDQCRIQ